MNRWVVALVAAVAALVLGVPIVVLLATPQDPCGSAAGSTAAIGQQPAGGGFSAENVTIAKAAADEAATRKLPSRALVVILATGFQESGIRNLSYGDRDSLGWLQQRANWGSVAERMNPRIAAGKFYAALVRVPGWESLPVTVAAQRVQVSAFPDAYAKWQSAAAKLAAIVGVGTSSPDACTAPAGAAGGGVVPADFNRQGNPRTVEQAVAWMRANMPHGARGEPVQGACERYMNLAYGLGGGYPTALSHWNAAGPRSPGYSAPPRGALVFFRTGNPAGHVALSLGNGIVVSTDYNSSTHRYQAGMLSAGPITDIDKWGPRLGWRAPNFKVGTEA